MSRDGLLRSARSEPCAIEEASLYLTQEAEDGLPPSSSAGRSAAKEASPHQPEAVTNGFVPSVVSDTEEIGISDGLEIPSTYIANGSPTLGTGTGVSQQFVFTIFKEWLTMLENQVDWKLKSP
jgi:hypothetical protein